MLGTPTLVATIIGKADSVGSAELNEHLAEKRAQAVFEALVYTNKVPENRVDMHFTGEHLPFVSTADEQAELQNRVVAIILRLARKWRGRGIARWIALRDVALFASNTRMPSQDGDLNEHWGGVGKTKRTFGPGCRRASAHSCQRGRDGAAYVAALRGRRLQLLKHREQS